MNSGPQAQTLTANNPILTHSPIKNTFSLVIPSLIGLIAFSSAAIIDGMFIGNYVGTSALAAINLLIPFINLIFGISYMLAIGGSVSAGKYIGEKNILGASGVFSKIMICAAALSLIVTTFGIFFDQHIFTALGGNDELRPYMAEYFNIRVFFLPIDIITIGLYYFIRTDGRATLAATALLISSLANIILDYIFIVQLNHGLKGAALATGLASTIPFIIFMIYFFTPYKKLTFKFIQTKWREVFTSCFNGLSEFINEVSISFIAFILNWMLITQHGTQGVAAITIINYLLMMGIMIFVSIAEAGQVFISQNYGARLFTRIKQYFLISMLICLLISAMCVGLLLGYTQFMIDLFLDDNSEKASQLAYQYVNILWPVFIFNGFTIMISAYFTGIHKANQSASIALLRSLILPCTLLATLYYWVDSIPFLYALPAAEAITFIIAVALYVMYRPSKIR
jgi:putative MATE family efflux protein